MAEKCKYWTCVMWAENLPDGWQDLVSIKFQNPCCYCIHNVKDPDENDFKWHVHFVLCFPNTTTYNHALSVFQSLCVPDNRVNYCERVFNIRYMYDYIIHDTEDAKKKGKHLYSVNDRICINSFDIHFFEQTSQVDKDNMLKQIKNIIRNNPHIYNFLDLEDVLDTMELDTSLVDEVLKCYHGFLSEYCKGNYLRYKFRKECDSNA